MGSSFSTWGPAVLGAGAGFLGSQSGGNQQDVTTTQEMPPWLSDAYQWNINRGQALADRPYTPYEGQRFAGFNPMQQNAFASSDLFGQMGLGALGQGYNALTDLTGAGMMGNAYGGLTGLSGLAAQWGLNANAMDTPQAQAMFGQFSGAGPASLAQAMFGDRGAIQDVEGGSFLDMNINDYMNPYTQGVVDNVMSDMERQWQQGDQIQRSQANAAGAFGGSRHGVLDALSTSEYQRNTGQLSNSLWNQAYGAATGLMGDDLARAINASLANQGMDWNIQNLNANLGTQTNQFNAGQQNNMSMFDAGNRNQMSMFNAGLGTQNNQFNAANMLQNQQWGQEFGLEGLQTAMTGMNMAGGLGTNMANFTQNQGRNLSDFGIQGLGAQMNAGNQIQNWMQNQNDFDYQQFLEARDWQANNAGLGINPLSGAGGYGSTTQPYFGPSGLQGALGGAMTGMSLYDMFFGQGSGALAAGGGGGAFSPTGVPGSA